MTGGICRQGVSGRGDKMNLSTDSRANHLLTGETLLMYEAELEWRCWCVWSHETVAQSNLKHWLAERLSSTHITVEKQKVHMVIAVFTP